MLLKNKKFAILGLGISGIATAKFLIEHNLPFIAWDDFPKAREKFLELLAVNNISVDTLTEDIASWASIDFLVLSPGIPLYFPKPHKFVELARKHKIKIICDIELFYLTYPNYTYIGITGTNGKSTTSALIHHILTENNFSSHLVGNIGNPILSLKPKSKNDIIVVEVSSYQLDLIDKTKFHIAILLNITEDHLDRHGTMENYIRAKYNIFRNHDKNDLAIISKDNSITNDIISKIRERKINVIPISTAETITEGCALVDKKIVDDVNHIEINVAANRFLLGMHNAENTIAAYSAVSCLHKLAAKEIVNAIVTYPGLDHRMQYLGNVGNIQFINDSKATSAVSSSNALKIFDNIYWIVGGLEKSDGIIPLTKFFDKILHAFLIGNAASEFSKVFDQHSVKYTIAGTLEKAFNFAVKMAEQNKETQVTILLSPACASFDQWKNFEERGNFFMSLVKEYVDAKNFRP